MNTFENAVRARCELARANIAVLIGFDEIAQDHAGLAYDLAYDSGVEAHETGAPVCTLLAEEPALLQAWKSGKSDAAADDACFN